jgi:tryptophanyl-tRNA synthetase
MGLLERCHSYKDKTAKGIAATHALFSYPVLMAADILAVNSNVVPVGRDQKQHVEVTRDIAAKFNQQFGETFVIPEPQIRDEVAVVPGVDGQKMSKSYNNTISLREDAESITRKIRTMPTDPARVKRSDPGDPDKCPVWQFHLVYSDEKTRNWADQGCRTAGIGCLECKQPVIDAVLAEQVPIRERAQKYLDDRTLVRNIVADGCEKARKLAQETMREVREAMGLGYT